MTKVAAGVAVASVAAITRASMASLSVGDAVELLKAGAARPVPAHRSHERRPTARHGLWLTIRSTATATPPCANALMPTIVASQAPSGDRAPPGS